MITAIFCIWIDYNLVSHVAQGQVLMSPSNLPIYLGVVIPIG